MTGLERSVSNTIVAHLGGGCSVNAVCGGASVNTSMGYTPLDGVAMGTRSGTRGLDVAAAADEVERTLESESGLRGLSGRSSDVREVAAASARGEARSSLALVFTGGIGEHAAVIRERICAKLAFAGIRLDVAANARARRCDDLGSRLSGACRRDCDPREEWFVARECARVLAATAP